MERPSEVSTLRGEMHHKHAHPLHLSHIIYGCDFDLLDGHDLRRAILTRGQPGGEVSRMMKVGLSNNPITPCALMVITEENDSSAVHLILLQCLVHLVLDGMCGLCEKLRFELKPAPTTACPRASLLSTSSIVDIVREWDDSR